MSLSVKGRWKFVSLVSLAVLAGISGMGTAFAQPSGACVLLHGGCGSPLQPQQCFPDALGPASWTDPGGTHTRQIRFAVQSSQSTCHGPVGIGAPPACCTSLHPPGAPGPSLKLRVEGKRIWVDYEAPNYYCQNTGDWPPFFTCANDPFLSSDHLFLFHGSADLLSRAFLYYESGSWDTGVDVSCGDTQPFTAFISYTSATGAVFAQDERTLTAACTDRRSCSGGGGPGMAVGAPVNVGSGDVSLAIPLFTLAQSPLSLGFSLTYHSETPLYPALVSSPLGLGWTHPYAQTLRATDPAGQFLYHVTAAGLESLYRRQDDGSWIAVSPGELRGRVVRTGSRYVLTDFDGTATSFDAVSGLWQETRDRWGNALTGSYDGSGRLAAVTDSEGRQIALTYIGGLLISVTLPDGSLWRLGYSGVELGAIFDPLHTGSTPWRTFSYQPDSQGVVRLLTAMQDEAGALLEGHDYDAKDRGTTSVSEAGRDLVTLQYDTPSQGQTTVTHQIDDTTSQESVFTLTYGVGRYLATRILGNCATCSGASSDDQSFTYSPDNHALSRTDANGHATLYGYNGDGNLTSLTEAAGAAEERVSLFRYDYAPWPNFQTAMDEPSAAKPGARKVTTKSWDSSAGLETKLTVTESGYLSPSDTAPTVYTRSETYDGRHRPTASDGPRTDVADVTTYQYFADSDADLNRRGRLRQVTDPVGLTTGYDDYDMFGTARRVTDANGVVSTRTTDARGRTRVSTAKAVAGDPNEATDYVTTQVWDGRDRLTRTILPRGNAMTYGYEDGTNRLVDTVRLDDSGNQAERRHLTLNDIGGTAREEDQSCDLPAAVCAAWTTKRSESFTYDVHNRLAQVLHPVPAGSKLTNTYDADGLLATVQDEEHTAPNTRYTYDALHRVKTVRQTLTGAPGGAAVTGYDYDVRDNLAAVTDPNGNRTTYLYDDFHRLARQKSPVTGVTTYRYDPAGDLLSTTDARGAVTTRAYDPAGRVLSVTAQLAGTATETVGYGYDDAVAGHYGLGRVARMTDPSGSTVYTYERRGLLKSEGKTTLGAAYTTGFQYDADGNRSGIIYPSGRQVTYTYDFADRPATAAAGTTSLVTSVSYLPFGPEASTVFGNGTVRTMRFDQRYRPQENRLDGTFGPIADYLYQEDGVGNIKVLQDALDPGYDRAFGYDDLYRLTAATTGEHLWGTGTYAYDPMGNMTSLSLGISGTGRSAGFFYAGTLPELADVTEGASRRAVAYDPAGNEAAVGGSVYTYSARNLLAAGDGLTYAYDGRGVRAAVTVAVAFGTIHGTVVSSFDGSPLASATVRITGTGNATATDAAGAFSLTAPAGIYTLTAGKPGFLDAPSFAFTLPEGSDVTVAPLQLDPAPGTIVGTVVSSLDGAPLAGVTVTEPGTGDATVTDQAGKLTLSEPAGAYSLKLSAAGYADQTVPGFALAAGTTKNLGTLTLIAAPALLTGRVVDSSTGAGLAGATVTATTVGSAATVRAAAVSFTATTDSTGAFSLQVPAAAYAVTVTKSGYGARSIAPLSVGPGVTQALGTLALDGLAAIHGFVVRAADSSPVAGATVSVTGTLNTTTTDASGAFTLTQPAGSWSLTVDAPGLVSLTTAPFVLAPGAGYDAGTLRLAAAALSVYVAYADNLRPTNNFPIPWEGSPATIFLGQGPVYDAGAIRLDNSTDQPLAVDRVTVDLQRPGPVYDLWGSFTVPAHGSVILTQPALFAFDTSDFPIAACGKTAAANDPRVPKVSVTIGGTAADYFDTGHILDTGGSDVGACTPSQNESRQWIRIGTTGGTPAGDFLLTPALAIATASNPYVLTALVTDGGGQPQPNVTVRFQVVAGPNALLTLQAVSDAAGRAVISYTSTISGTDTWQASIPNASGGAKTSNLAAVTWPALAGLDLFVGYADDLRPNSSFPTPWQGSPNVLFLGNRGNDFDGGAMRLDNTTDAPIPVDKVTVDLQRRSYNGPVFDLWPTFVIPPHSSAILTQTDTENFDTSDFPIYGCEFPIFPGEKQTPKIAVTVHALSTSYLDIAHVLDTGGFDANCQLLNESRQWREVGLSGQTSGQLVLQPATAAAAAGAVATVTAVALDGAGDALPNVAVSFIVLSGPNAGKTSQATTGSTGAAVFTYGGTATGTDTLQATISNSAGGVVPSGTATVRWVPQVSLTLTPASAAHGLGTVADFLVRATDAAGQPVQSLAVTFRVASGPSAGPSAGRTGHGITDANGQAGFSLSSNTPGIDTVDAELILLGGGSQASNPATVTWTAASTLTLAPPATILPVGGQATLTAQLLDGTHHPVANAAVTVSVLSGPNAGSSGQSTTDATGQALFTYTGNAQGTDVLQATAGAQLSNLVTATWTAVPTLVTYTGARTGEPGDLLHLAARLTESLTGAPITGQTLTFVLGTQTVTATTGPDGVATATVTPPGPAGTVPLAITFAGNGPYTGSSAALLISLQRVPTTLVYTGRAVIANGQPQPVSARLTDTRTGQPLSGQTITFTVGTLTATAVTDATGTAVATLTLPATTGTATWKAAYAGDAAHLPSSTRTRLLIYQPSSFVLWGGNTPGLLVGQRVNFWGSQWKAQVTGGDYAAQADFKGYGRTTTGAVTLCEPTARTTGTPRLDQTCWTSKPGNSNPPATLGDFIQVIVSTSINKSGSTIYGNIASTVVIQVDRSTPYAPDPGHPGYGTIVAVIDDAGLFSQPTTVTSTAESATASATSAALPLAVATGNHRYSLYSPELHLIAETELSTATRPAVMNEYVWLNGHPIAQIDGTGVTNWTFTDHLGTPILQTSAAQGVTWRAEYEPFGEVYALRSYDKHQPLRLPGQEAEQLAVGANGVTERSYNIHRWYRSGWGRYSQADPAGLTGGLNLLAYSLANPIRLQDPLGFVPDAENCTTCCSPSETTKEFFDITNYIEAHKSRYRILKHIFRHGCGGAADLMKKDVERDIQPKCWITKSQLTRRVSQINRISYKLFGYNAWIHGVLALRPCSSSGTLGGEAGIDPYLGIGPFGLESLGNNIAGPLIPDPIFEGFGVVVGAHEAVEGVDDPYCGR